MNQELTDYRAYIVNAFVFIFSFSNAEEALKIISLLIAIGYTLRRWYLMEKNKKQDNEVRQ